MSEKDAPLDDVPIEVKPSPVERVSVELPIPAGPQVLSALADTVDETEIIDAIYCEVSADGVTWWPWGSATQCQAAPDPLNGKTINRPGFFVDAPTHAVNGAPAHPKAAGAVPTAFKMRTRIIHKKAMVPVAAAKAGRLKIVRALAEGTA